MSDGYSAAAAAPPVFQGPELRGGSMETDSTDPTPHTSPESGVLPGFSDTSTRSSQSSRPQGILKQRSKCRPTGSRGQSDASSTSEDDRSFSDAATAAGKRSSMQLLGDLARQSVDSIAGLWTVAEAAAEQSPPETTEDAAEIDSRESEHVGARLQSAGSPSARQPPASEGVVDASFRRMSSFITEGLWPAMAEDSEPDFIYGASSSSSSGPPSTTATAGRQAVDFDFDEMRREVRRPFQRLLADIPQPGTEAEVYLKTKVGLRLEGQPADDCEGSDNDDREARSPLHSAVARSRLIARVLGCCDAVFCELSQDEAVLWEAFITSDTRLRGVMNVRGKELRNVLCQLSSSDDIIAGWLEAIAVWADDGDEVDFADLLDWFAREQQNDTMWTLQSSLRNSFSQLLSVNSEPLGVRMRPELLTSLRNRLASMQLPMLAKVAATCHRTLVLTSWCQCERKLISLVTPAITVTEEARGPPPGLVSALIAILRGINAELAPTERVLWELLGTKDSNFDGAIDKSEVLAAIGELLVYSIERELGTPEGEFEELQRLRADCRARSVDALFDDQQYRSYVTLADVLRWWWDMSEEYRVAAGLTVPANLLRRSLHRRPEEMFRDRLPKMAASPAAARVALHGHARVLSELRALAVSRALENLNGGNTPADTRTTTSCASITSECKSRDAEEDEDHLAEDCASGAAPESMEPPSEATSVGAAAADASIPGATGVCGSEASF